MNIEVGMLQATLLNKAPSSLVPRPPHRWPGYEARLPVTVDAMCRVH